MSIATATNTITATYTENTTSQERAGEITITPVLSSGRPTPIVISFTQIGVPGIDLTLSEAVRVGHLAGRLVIGVDVLGTGVSWEVEETTNPTGFLTFPGTITASDGSNATGSAGADGDVLTIAYGQNDGAERVATLTFEAVDGDGNSYTPKATQVLTITQGGGVPTLSVSAPVLTPATNNITALPADGGGSITYNVTIGGGATDFNVEIVQGLFFGFTKDILNSTILLLLNRNEDTDSESREGGLRISTIGGGGSPADTVVYLRQLGTAAAGISARSTPNLNVVQHVPATEGSVSFALTLFGEANEWAATLSTNPGDFLTLGASSGNHGDALVVSYAVHTAATERVGVLTLTPSGASGDGTPLSINISQRRATGPLLEVTPSAGANFRLLPATAGTIVAGVSLSGGATDFTATESSDFIDIGTKDGTNNTQAIDF